MLRTDPVMFEDKEIVPIQFLKALLPDPASLGPRTVGKTIREVMRIANYARTEINKIGGYYAYGKELINGDSVFDFDPTKLTVYTLDIGLAGIEVYDLLRDEYDIQLELGDMGNVLAYISIGDRMREVERLVSALVDVKRRYCKDRTGLFDHEYINPSVVMTPQEAFYAPKEEMIPIRETNGRICTEFVMCYPPGIPILAPWRASSVACPRYCVETMLKS